MPGCSLNEKTFSNGISKLYPWSEIRSGDQITQLDGNKGTADTITFIETINRINYVVIYLLILLEDTERIWGEWLSPNMQSFLNREYHKAVGQAEGRNKVIKRIKTVLDEVSAKPGCGVG